MHDSARAVLIALGVMMEPGGVDCPTCLAPEGCPCVPVTPRDRVMMEPIPPGYSHHARAVRAQRYTARNALALVIVAALFLAALIHR